MGLSQLEECTEPTSTSEQVRGLLAQENHTRTETLTVPLATQDQLLASTATEL